MRRAPLAVALVVVGLVIVAAFGWWLIARDSSSAFVSQPGEGDLTRAEASTLIAEADARIAQVPADFEPESQCWFDRLPSELIDVVCGPIVGSSDLSSQVELGPPFFRVYQLTSTEQDDGSRVLQLGAADDFNVLSFANYPTSLFRPDGRKLQP
jgi:hypothetical protein